MLPRERAAHYRAFQTGAPVCESLGACHLLAHSIWAFKTSAEGNAPILSSGVPRDITDEVRFASQGVILTEWKRCATNPLILFVCARSGFGMCLR